VADQNNDQTDRNNCGPALKITKNHHLGRMLSGGILLDDSQTKSEWLQRADYHTCIGGEMEGWSVYTVCRYSNVHWIVIKGVCDWREHKIKGYQPLTVAIAVDLVRHVLSWPEALQAIPIQSATPQAAPDRHQEESHQQGAVFHSGNTITAGNGNTLHFPLEINQTHERNFVAKNTDTVNIITHQ